MKWMLFFMIWMMLLAGCVNEAEKAEVVDVVNHSHFVSNEIGGWNE